jgi:2-polyprenyl-6-methoxyphenol hydroxylase-like FAD-dependent oxidoreductase
MAVYVDHLRLMDAMTAEEICHVDLGEAFRMRFGNPYAVVHRGDLHGVFLKACRDSDLIDLRVSAEVVGYDQDGSSVTAKLVSGDRVTGSLLIGADGLWSNIRKQVAGDGQPRVSGHTTYRSVIPTEQMPEDLRWNAATLWAGPKCHLVHYPLSGWKVFNLVVTCHNDAPEPVAGKPVPKDEVMRGFAHIHQRALDIIRHGTNWKLWVLCDRDPTERWIDGRVVLLGDAAHPMLQYFAQGACQAMEDAVCLSHMLGNHDTASALEKYRELRFPRTARVQLMSRVIGEHIYHPSGEHARLRNAIMSAKSQAEWQGDLAWLYGGTGLKG